MLKLEGLWEADDLWKEAFEIWNLAVKLQLKCDDSKEKIFRLKEYSHVHGSSSISSVEKWTIRQVHEYNLKAIKTH